MAGTAEATLSGRLRRRLAWGAAVFLVVATACGTALALINHSPAASRATAASSGIGHGARGGRAATAGAEALTGLSDAAIVRSRAASWIVREVSQSAIIACDAVMCNQLFNAGLPASDLLVLSPTASSPLGADLVISTPALRSEFGSRLAREYAPLVIASFGQGESLLQVRVVAPDGAAAYHVAFDHDLTARQHDGTMLLRNGSIAVAPLAKPDLIAGLVDSRLLVMLPVLAEQHPIDVLGFYDRAPRASRGVPLTGVELAASDKAAGLSAHAYVKWLIAFVGDQRSPYRAVGVTTARIRGREVVLVRFARPSPIGLLNGSVSGSYAY